MRLIDADALCKRLMAVCEIADKSAHNKYTRGICFGSKNALGIVEEAPTIDPESLRPQAEWVDAEDGDGIVCPACGEDFCVLTNETERFKFCPNCGAKMKGAGEDA